MQDLTIRFCPATEDDQALPLTQFEKQIGNPVTPSVDYIQYWLSIFRQDNDVVDEAIMRNSFLPPIWNMQRFQCCNYLIKTITVRAHPIDDALRWRIRPSF